MAKIRFKILQNGDVQVIDAEGFGSSCGNHLKPLEEALGVADESTRELTESYYQEAEQGVNT